MGNLTSLNNLYADLAQGAYLGRKFNDRNVSYGEMFNVKDINKSIKINMPIVNDANGNEIANVYLQKETKSMSDNDTGFNSYFLTDTAKLDSGTKHTYFSIRGSDGGFIKNHNDWIDNDANFALTNSNISQAQNATKAMHEKIVQMSQQSPKATMSVTGHSLGTMVSLQGVANLPSQDIDKIDKVVLFDGPDTRESINKMSPEAQANISKLEEQGKIEYYLNPFDLVSLLNRNKNGVDEVGHIHYILPDKITSSLDSDNSAHDFSQFQMNPDGTPKEATIKDSPEYIAAAIDISHLINGNMDKLKSLVGDAFGLNDLLIAYQNGGEGALTALLHASGYKGTIIIAVIGLVVGTYNGYNKIIRQTQAESEIEDRIKDIKNKISSTGVDQYYETLSLEMQLAGLLCAKADKAANSSMTIYNEKINEDESNVDTAVNEIHDGAYAIKRYLSDSEVMGLIANYTKPALWDGGQKSVDDTEVTKYKNKMGKFSKQISYFSNAMAEFDTEKAKDIEAGDYLTGKSVVTSKYNSSNTIAGGY